jgi:putative inorganic carbon (HCO3(-)) transporter
MDTKKLLRPLNYLFVALFAVIPWSLALMQILLGAVCAYILVISIMTRKNYFRFHYFYLLPAVFILSQITAALCSEHVDISLRNLIHTYWVILTIPFVASLPLRSSDRLNAVNTLILSSAIAGLYGIFQFFTGVNLLGGTVLSQLGKYYRAIGTYSFFLTFAGNQLMVFAFAFIFAIEAEKDYRKRFYLATVVLIGLSIVATQGRSAWLGVIMILILASILFYRKRFLKIAGTGAVLFLVIILVFPDIRDRFMNIFLVTNKFNLGRISLWQSSILMIRDHPWFGIGPGLFEQTLDLYRVEGFYNATSHAHNDYLHIAVQSGLPSLAVWTSIWISFFIYGYRFLSSEPENRSDRLITMAALLAIAGILTASTSQCYFFDLENNILWWVIISTTLQIFIRPRPENV